MKQKSTILNRKRLILFVCAVLFGIASSAWGAASDYYGNYSGSYTGDDNGHWVATFNSSQSLFLSYSTSTGYGDGGELNLVDNGDSASFYGTSTLSYTDISGSISSTGAVTGSWDNSGDDGDFSGSPITSLSYAGTYTGTISGYESGTCTITIDEDGYAYGSVTTGGDTVQFVGGASPEDVVVVGGEDDDEDAFIVAGVRSGSTISGRWQSEAGDEVNGTFTVSIGGTSGGDDDSGGCFINSLF